jgi:hypothetical protein
MNTHSNILFSHLNRLPENDDWIESLFRQWMKYMSHARNFIGRAYSRIMSWLCLQVWYENIVKRHVLIPSGRIAEDAQTRESGQHLSHWVSVPSWWKVDSYSSSSSSSLSKFRNHILYILVTSLDRSSQYTANQINKSIVGNRLTLIFCKRAVWTELYSCYTTHSSSNNYY